MQFEYNVNRRQRKRKAKFALAFRVIKRKTAVDILYLNSVEMQLVLSQDNAG